MATERRYNRDSQIILGGIFGSHILPDDLEFVAKYGSGNRLVTTDGREYVDYVLGSGPLVLGYAHPKVVAAIKDQASRGTHLYAMTETAQALADEVNRLVPCAKGLKFVGSGAEATFYALKIARAFTGRSKIIRFQGGYHGHHDYAQSGRLLVNGETNADELLSSPGVPPQLADTVLIVPFNDLETVQNVARRYAEDLAAIIVEPVQRSIPPLPGFLEGLRALADELQAILVFDEMVTGFRLAPGGAQEAFGVTPDLCAMGKIVGGGLPLALVAGRRDLLELSVPERSDDGRSIWLSGTLNGNPLSCAAGLATLGVLNEEDGYRKIRKAGEQLALQLSEIATKLSIPFQMLGPAAFGEPVFSKNVIRNAVDLQVTNRKAAQEFSIELIKRGQHVLVGSKLYISMLHDEDDISQTASAAEEAMLALRDRGYFDNC